MVEKENKLVKEYESLQKKHNLPSLSDLEKDFALSEIETEKYPLIEVRKKICDKIEVYAATLSHLFEGEASVSALYETRLLDENSKAELFKIYKRLMKYLRKSSILSLSYNEKEEVEFIKEFIKEWESIRKELKKYLTVFYDSWDSNSESIEDIQNYLG